MIGLGAFPAQIVFVLGAALLAWMSARAVARRAEPAVPHKAAGALLLDALMCGLLFARVGYIARWWQDYWASPMAIFAIGDGGFIWWVGMLAAVAFVMLRTRAAGQARRPVLAGIVVGMTIWFGANGVLDLLRRSAPPLPAVSLATLDAHPVTLDNFRGRPVVLNLWASWCPPCRREMPVLEHAQAAWPGVAFVLVNQGESAQQARAFLNREGLDLEHVLLDPSSKTMQAVGARALPTTLFFNAEGRLVDTHMGELTLAGLKGTLSRRFALSAEPKQD